MSEPSPALHADRLRASSFGHDAVQYDRARPTYPASLIDFLMRGDPATVIDVGCGTGIASRLLLERGCHVLGVEPDPRMAAVAASRGLEVEVATFEAWPSRGRQFELLISAQSWHWVDPVIGAAKAADLLVGGGTFGCFWNVGQPDERERAAFAACYRRFAPGVEEDSVVLGHGHADRVARAAEAFTLDGHFSGIEATTFPHRIRYTTVEWLDHLDTHSNHQTLAPAAKAALFTAIGAAIDGVGGAFELQYETVGVNGHRREN